MDYEHFIALHLDQGMRIDRLFAGPDTAMSNKTGLAVHRTDNKTAQIIITYTAVTAPNSASCDSLRYVFDCYVDQRTSSLSLFLLEIRPVR